MHYHIVLFDKKLSVVEEAYVRFELPDAYLEEIQRFTVELHRHPEYLIQVTLVVNKKEGK